MQLTIILSISKHTIQVLKIFLNMKPDTPNPLVTMYVADLADLKNIQTKKVKPPAAIENS